MTYQILHKETPVAQIDTQGHCHIFSKKFMPYNFYLEETNNDPINNLSNFYFWCANRILPANRQHRDVILKSLNLTSKEPAQIALLCHCLSLTDVYWVRTSNEFIAFQDINLYDNHAENSLIDASLLGKQITMPSLKALKDLSTDGRFPKAWLNNTLLKGGNPIVVRNEILASKICQCFQCSQVIYEEGIYKGELVSISNIFTSKEYSIISKEAFDIYAVNHDIDPIKYILSLDAYSYYMMNILDYLTGNTDRHWGNWGFLIDNQTNTPISLHPLMDFNQAFTAYDSMEGANCLTTPIPMT